MQKTNENECRNQLLKLVDKKYIHFTSRCNNAIKKALEYCKHKGYKKIYIPDQGGWLTYKKDPKHYDLEIIEFKTDKGRFNPKIIEQEEFESEAVLLIHSLAGYVYPLAMKQIYESCRAKNIFLINDVCGSIGLDQAKYGDIVVCSFGKWKPLAIGKGGFIAYNNEKIKHYFDEKIKQNYEFKEQLEYPIDYKALKEKIANLPLTRSQIAEKCSIIAKSLKSYNVQYTKDSGLNIIIPYKSEQEYQALISFCKDNDLEYTKCPRYIRIIEDAISIEVKRQIPMCKKNNKSTE